MKALPAIFVFVLLLCMSIVILPTATSQTDPPTDGDWTVADTTLVKDEVIVLNGNLTVTTSGKLTLINCTLKMNSTKDHSTWISIEGALFGSQGELVLTNTTIEAYNESYPYNFTVQGKMTAKYSTIKDLGGSIDMEDPLSSAGGIVIHYSGVLIEETNITNYQTIGIMVMPTANPTIRRCNISMPVNFSSPALTVGIVDTTVGFLSSTYEENNFTGNLVSGILSVGTPMGSTFSTIEGNVFYQNTVGITCFGTSPDIIDNTFNTCVGGVGLYDSDSEISGNDFNGSGSAITVLNPSDPVIFDNTIRNSLIYGITMMNGTTAEVYDNIITNTVHQGMKIVGSDPEVYGNEVHDSLNIGVFMDDSAAEFHDNVIDGAYRGMVIMNDSAPMINNNDIILGDYGIGIVMDGNVSMVPWLEDNLIEVGNNATGIRIDGFSPRMIENSVHFWESSNGLNATGSVLDMEKNTFNTTKGFNSIYLVDSDLDSEKMNFNGAWVGLHAENSSVALRMGRLYQIGGPGIDLNHCQNVEIDQVEFVDVSWNTPGTHDNVEVRINNCSNVKLNAKPSYIKLVNSSYVEPVLVEAGGKVEVDWFLDVEVLNKDLSPAPGVSVTAKNRTGTTTNTFVTDAQGMTVWNRITEKVFLNTTTIDHTPYDIRAVSGMLEDNETVQMNTSRSIQLILDFNQGPGLPGPIDPGITHNQTPLITWNRSVDPNNDPVEYNLSIGTSAGAKDVLYEHTTMERSYQVPVVLAFGRYYVTLSAQTPDGNSSAVYSTTLDIINTPPMLQPIGQINVYLDVNPVLKMKLNASDNDTDPIDTLTYSDTCTLFDVDPMTGEVNWTANGSVAGVYRFNFTVSDGKGGIDTETVDLIVGVLNKAPTADAGANIKAFMGDKVYLDGTNSTDPDGFISSFHWTAPAGITLNTTNPGRPFFVPTEVGNLTFKLKVKDNNNTISDEDSVIVEVIEKKVVEPDIYTYIELSNPSVTPVSGTLEDYFIFKITVTGFNVTDDLKWLFKQNDFMKVEVDSNTSFNMARALDKNLSDGVEFTVSKIGTYIGEGSHSYKFSCRFDEIKGDIGPFVGPEIKKVDTPPTPDDDIVPDDDDDDNNDTQSNTGTFAVAIIIVIIIAILVFIGVMVYLMRYKTSEIDGGALRDEKEEQEDEDKDDLDDGLNEMDRDELKDYILDMDLTIKVTKKMKDDDIRQAIRDAEKEDMDDLLGDDEEELDEEEIDEEEDLLGDEEEEINEDEDFLDEEDIDEDDDFLDEEDIDEDEFNEDGFDDEDEDEFDEEEDIEEDEFD